MKKLAMLLILITILSTLQIGRTASQPAPSGPNGVLAYLTRAAHASRSDGLVELRQPEGGVLSAGRTMSTRIDLEAGREYHVLGTCDEHCADLDLMLVGPDGRSLERDGAADKRPFIRSQPAANGRHRIDVTMRDCARQSCFFAIVILVR